MDEREDCKICSDRKYIYCQDCLSSFCNACYRFIHEKENKNHNIVKSKILSSNENFSNCQIHPKEQLKFSCKSCNFRLLCIECSFDKEHKSHSVITFQEFSEILSEKLLKFDNEYQSILYDSNFFVEKLNKLITEKDTAFTKSRKKIEEDFKRIEEIIQQKKRYMLNYLDSIYLSKKKIYNTIIEKNNILVESLNEKFFTGLDMGMSNNNRNNVVDQKLKIENLNELIENLKINIFETQILCENFDRAETKICTKNVLKSLQELWFVEIDKINFKTYLEKDKVIIENIEGINISDNFSEIKELSNTVLFKDLSNYENLFKKSVLEIDSEAFKSDILKFRLFPKYTNSFLGFEKKICLRKYSQIKSFDNHFSTKPPITGWFGSFQDSHSKIISFSFSSDDSLYQINCIDDLVNQKFDKTKIEVKFDGTYLMQENDYVYLNLNENNGVSIYNKTKKKTEITLNLNGICSKNTGCFRWGGLTDVSFIYDAGEHRKYVIYQKESKDNFCILSEIKDTLNLQNPFIIPIPKKEIGFCFIYNGILYIGSYHYKAEINFIIKLTNSGIYLEAKKILISEGESFITHANIVDTEKGLKLIICDYNSGIKVFNVLL